MITLNKREWNAIYAKLKVDWAHKPSVFLIRNVMRRELGFTPREHHSDVASMVYLDFYDEPAEIMFRLKYL